MSNQGYIIGGASDGMKSFSIAPGQSWILGKGPDDNDSLTPERAYATVPWVYRCVKLRSDTLSSIPNGIYTRGTDIKQTNAPDLSWLLWQTEAALSIEGVSYGLKARLPNGTNYIRWLNPTTMEVEYNENGITGFVQKVNGKERHFDPDSIVYIKLFHPEDDIGPGVSPTKTILEDARLLSAITQYASKFFEHGAVTPVLLTSDKPVVEAEADRIRAIWDRLYSGLKNFWRTAVLPAGIKPMVVGQTITDLAMPSLEKGIRARVAAAYGIPQSMVDLPANYATARENRLSFYLETVMPQARLIQSGLNQQFFYDLGLEFVFNFEELEIMQQDEAEKANGITKLIEAGIITPTEARPLFGYTGKAPLTSQDVVLGRANSGNPVVGNSSNAKPVVQVPPLKPLAAEKSEIAKWRKKSLHAIRAGRSANVGFESGIIRDEVKAVITSGLESAKSLDAAKAVFEYWEHALG